MKYLFNLLLFLFFATVGLAQDDSLNYNLYRQKVVLYTDIGYKSMPFTIKTDFAGSVKSLAYKHNYRTLLGFGIAYKWFSLRLGFALPGHLKAVSRYGKSNYGDLGFKFSIKKTFWDVDLRLNNGYAIKDAYKWNDTLNKLNPNDIRYQVKTASFSINSWYFLSKQFKMQPVFGITGDFRRSTGTIFLKTTLNFFGVSADRGGIIPTELADSLNTKTYSSAISAVDMGLVPGYAYVYRLKNWQTSVFAGLGGVMQSKFYVVNGATRSFAGLAARVDFRLITGFSKPKSFIWLVTDFDIKSIGFDLGKFSYQQTFYSIALVGGFRFGKK